MLVAHRKIKFKDLFAHCVTTLGVLTFQEKCHHSVGVLLNSFTSLSVEPLLISFNLSIQGYIWEKFRDTEYFALHILSASQSDIAQQFINPRNVNWKDIPYFKSRKGVPLLYNTVGILEAKVKKNFYITIIVL